MDNKQSAEITWGYIFGKIFKHYATLMAITIIVAILGTFLINYSNRGKVEYSSTFSIEYPNSQLLTYPDGSAFQYTDIISLSTLKTIKDSNDEYSDIDVEKMSSEGDIAISRAIDDITKNFSYTISVKKNYFQSKELAKSFIADLATSPLKKVKSTIQDMQHSNYVSSYNGLLSYDQKVLLFNSQLNFLLKSYDDCISKYGNITVNNKSLITHKQEVENYLCTRPTSVLQSEIAIYGYAFRDDELAREYENEQKVFIAQVEENEKELADIETTINNPATNPQLLSSYYSRKTELQKENAIISKQIANLTDKIAYAKGDIPVNTEFESKLANYHSKVEEFTNNYANNIIAIYENQSSVSFDYSSVISESESTSIIVAVLIGLIIGFIIACIVCLIVDGVKNKKSLSVENE